MNRLKKIHVYAAIALAFSMVMLFTFPTAKVHAFPGRYFWFPQEMHVRIRHPGSGLYLGIEQRGMDSSGRSLDGARLQLQKYDKDNPMQVFYLRPVARDANGHIQYQIRIHGESGQILEIRNSSMDDWAEATQWTEHSLNCAKWYFYTETDRNGRDSATCCIKNVNSGKLLNVSGGRGIAGNGLIQYHEDNTSAEVFYVEHTSISNGRISPDKSITVFKQNDARWKNSPYGKGPNGQNATLGSAGCGIFAYVNAVYYMNGNVMDPVSLGNWSVQNGYRINGVGTSYDLYKGYADRCGSVYGIRYIRSASRLSDIRNDLQNGRTAILGVSNHIIACVNYSNGKYLILDSYPSSGRGTSSGYRWLTESQFTGKLRISNIRVIGPR